MDNKTVAKREISIVTWKEVRDEVLKVNPELGQLIDFIDPSDDYKLIKASYLYGDLFVDNGVAQLPINNKLLPTSDPSINKQLKDELSYNLMPLTLILDKDSEFFIKAGERNVPVNLFHKGDLTGTYETMDYMTGRESRSSWSLCAGSCSIFMLPKITDKTGLKRLTSKYNIPATTQISKLSDHGEVFKTIAQNENFSQPWKNTVLFFGKKWLDKHDSKEWYNFRDYLIKTIWEQANFAIDKTKFNMCWESCSRIISLRRLQPKPYLIDHVKHLLSIVARNFPGFVVIDNSQESAPTNSLQKVFTEEYGLKEYLPTLMHARMLSKHTKNPSYTYYSLSIPTILEGSPLKKTTGTILNDLREIKILMETLKNNSSKIKLNHQTYRIIQCIEEDYFHYENDIYHQIKSSTNIPIEDPSFTRDEERFPGRSFCATSQFFSGCIRLSRKK
ncbi:MAG: hypothetical protein KKE11_01740 [Gammaproteobacteria bacterium]|nr:hypothetical protein [Gammaproteobacteria bacterium]